MSMKMVSHAIYECDVCCTKVEGWVHEVPDRWTAEHTNAATLHYCPKCNPDDPARHQPHLKKETLDGVVPTALHSIPK